MDFDLGHLPGAKGNVGKELSRSRAGKPDETFVFFTGLLTSGVHVRIFEDLIKTVLEGALEGVTNQSRPETFPGTRNTLLGNDGSEPRHKTLVLLGADLKNARVEKSEHKNAFPMGGMPHTCMLHLVTSSGVIPAWVVPQAKTPPSTHLE